MSVTPSSAVVGVFREQAVAEQAADAFFNAGFTNEQVLRSTPESSGGFFEDLKNLFTGSNSGSSDVASNLTSMGISQDDAHYYAQEHRDGNTIIAVHAPGREQEAQAIMHQYGAYNTPARSDDTLQNTTSTTQTSDTITTPVSADTSPTQDTQQSVEGQSYQQDVQHSPNFILVPDSNQPEQASQTYTEQSGSDPYHQEATQAHDTAQTTGSDEDTGKYATYSGSTDSTNPEQNAQPLTADYASSEPHTDVSGQASQPEASTYNTTSDTNQPVTTDTFDNQPTHETTPSYYSDQETPSIAQDTEPVTHDSEPQDIHNTDVYASSPVVDDSASSTEPQATNATDTHEATPVTEQPTTAEAQTGEQMTTEEPQATYVTDTHETSPIVDQTAPTESETTQQATDMQNAPTNTASTEQPVEDVSNVNTEPLAVHTASSTTDKQNGQNAAPVANTDIAEAQTESTPVTTATTDDTVTPEASVTAVTTPESAPSTAGSTADTDDLDQLQQQYAAMQQQLQDVQAQLQAAREQEAHLKATQARRQQIEALRQQMQALQAELAAAHAELQDTHARLNQYQ